MLCTFKCLEMQFCDLDVSTLHEGPLLTTDYSHLKDKYGAVWGNPYHLIDNI